MDADSLITYVALRSTSAGHDVKVYSCDVSPNKSTGHLSEHITVDARSEHCFLIKFSGHAQSMLENGSSSRQEPSH